MKTLKQALRFEGERVQIPLLEVFDAADLAERGFWDYFYPCPIRSESEMHTLQTRDEWFRFIDDLADFKINLMELLLWDEGLYYNSERFPELVEPGTPAGKNALVRDVLEYARARGVQCFLATSHPEHFTRLLETHPELRAIKPTGVQPSLLPRLFCFSDSRTRGLFGGIVEEIGELFDPDGVIMWLPENLGQCNCRCCREKGYLAQYTSLYEEPFARLRRRQPALRKRFLVSFLRYSDRVLPMIPEDAELEYYECDRHGMYSCDEHKRLSPFVARAAKSGRRVVGCMSYRGSGVGYVPLPYFSTVTEWVRLMHRDRYCGVSGSLYSNPGVCRPNLLRMADAAWDIAGHGDYAFAHAYAVRHSQSRPADHAAAMVVLSGSWDLYHSRQGDLLVSHALDWILHRHGANAVDGQYVVDALEDTDLPRLERQLELLATAAEAARALEDERLDAQFQICRALLGTMHHCLAALHVYGRQQWPDPEKGSWTDWIEAIIDHARSALELLEGIPEATSRLPSTWPNVQGSPAKDLDSVAGRLRRILEPSFRETLEQRAWPDINAFA